ncbi:MAG TPA: hypothetical protein VIJ14_04505, partial [Rhabdochlamydiaceae bacterium]
MLGVRLFPQVLSDLNFFNVRSQTDLASRLRAVQRVVAATLGAYLMVRYEPILIAKLGSNCSAEGLVKIAFLVSYGCLSMPTTILILSGVTGYRHMLYAVSSNKEIGWKVLNVAMVVVCYVNFQNYRHSIFM